MRNYSFDSKAVIPAKAGIYRNCKRIPASAGMTRKIVIPTKVGIYQWIPAFAGMTVLFTFFFIHPVFAVTKHCQLSGANPGEDNGLSLISCTTKSDCTKKADADCKKDPKLQMCINKGLINCVADTAKEANNLPKSQTGNYSLYNPLGDVTIQGLIGRIIRSILGVVGAIALLVFVYGGFLWMTAANSKRVEEGKRILIDATIGLLIIFFSYSIASLFINAVTIGGV